MTGAAKQKIAVIGGTGALGFGLAWRIARAGFPVIIGSRTADKAAEAAKKLETSPGGPSATGATNADAARQGDILLVTVPWGSQAAILEEIKAHAAGKIVVDTTVPLVPPKVARVQLPEQGCAALAAQQRLGAGIRVVSAFHNVAAHKLAKSERIECDVLVFGDEPKDRDVVADLVKAIGLRPVHGGPLANSAAAEALTSVLIGINKKYAADGAGIVITGLGSA